MWMVVWSIGGWFAKALMASVHVSMTGRVRVLWTCGCDHVRPMGRWKMGKEDGRMDMRGVGIWTDGVKNSSQMFQLQN